MTKAELISKIASRAGVHKSEAEVFFESFLKKIASNINAGGAVHIENVGRFFIKEGISDNQNSKISKPKIEHKYSDLVVFQSEESLNSEEPLTQEESAPLVFNLPDLNGSGQSGIDSIFSLGFGKPLINQPEEIGEDAYVPLSRAEQKIQMESKAEKLFSEAKIQDESSAEEDKYFYLSPKIKKDEAPVFSVENEIPKEVISAEEVSADEVSEEQKPEIDVAEAEPEVENEPVPETEADEDVDISEIVKENLEWDFGVPSEEVYEEESILPEAVPVIPEGTEEQTVTEFIPDEAELSSTLQEIPAETENFAAAILEEIPEQTEPEQTEPVPAVFEQNEAEQAEEEAEALWAESQSAAETGNTTDFEPKEEKEEELSWDFGGYDKQIEFENSVMHGKTEDEVEQFSSENEEPEFQSVDSITSKLQKLTVAEDQLQWDFGGPKQPDNQFVSEYQPEALNEVVGEDGFVQVNGKKNKLIFEEDLIKEKSDQKIAEENAISQDEKAMEFKQIQVDKKKEPGFQKALRYSFTGLIIIALVALGLYSYFKYVKHKDLIRGFKSEQVAAETGAKKTEMIERNYDVPVTYPYNKKDIPPAEAANNSSANAQGAGAQANQAVSPVQAKEAAKQTQQKQKQSNEDLSAEEMFSKKNPGNILNKNKNVKPVDEKKKETATKQEKAAPKTAANKQTAAVKPDSKPVAGGHIFADGGKFAFQLSSWPNKEKAEQEAAKFKKSGYSAYIASAYIEKYKNTWYRVRIGGFSTKEEAESAYRKLFK
jgi:cell division protein FtsN/nucleoid DNA-binding protein